MMIRDDLDAGLLTRGQAKLYNQLGRHVEIVTKDMEATADSQAAEALWRTAPNTSTTSLPNISPARQNTKGATDPAKGINDASDNIIQNLMF